jgi:beta-glucosidase
VIIASIGMLQENMSNKSLKFPKDFLWGASTSSHQVEGGNINDWSEWEKSEKRIKYLKKKRLLDKYGIKNFISGLSTDHYYRYKDDFKLAKELGHNATRFSIEWSRIEPEEGVFNEKEINHYKEVLFTLQELQIKPFVTLWHFTNPLWFSKKGGWENKKSVDYFARYVEKIVGHLGNLSEFLITLNEPEVYTGESYLMKGWPPQKINIFLLFRVLKNLEEAHKKAYQIIKEKDNNLKVGIAKNCIYFETYKNIFCNFIFKKPLDYLWNFYFLDRIKDYQDFIGLNYYFIKRIFLSLRKSDRKYSDMCWELYPQGIYYVLKDLNKRYKKPIYITENGLADKEDKYREWFILETLKYIKKALDESIDVRGYFHWSLLDNFEWAEGFWPRFGLIEVNYDTLERKVRNSAYAYKRIIEENKN